MAWNNFKDNVFVINLEKDKSKLNKVNKSYNSEGIRLNRVDAVYGRTLNSSSRKKELVDNSKTRKKREELSISAIKSIKKEDIEISLTFN